MISYNDKDIILDTWNKNIRHVRKKLKIFSNMCLSIDLIRICSQILTSLINSETKNTEIQNMNNFKL
jgi:hypothetical protein